MKTSQVWQAMCGHWDGSLGRWVLQILTLPHCFVHLLLLLQQVVTDNYPFPETKNANLITIKVIMGQLPSVYNDDHLSQIYLLCDVMVRCWRAEPKARPSAVECRKALQWIVSRELHESSQSFKRHLCDSLSRFREQQKTKFDPLLF